MSNDIVTVANDDAPDDKELAQVKLSEWVGQRKFSSALQKLLTVSDLVEIQKIKESKAYKGLKVEIAGKLLTVSTFEQFCESFGASGKHVNEQLLNLGIFGPEFLEFSDQAIGYRGLRTLRRLPEDTRAALIDVANTGNKDDLLNLAEELLEKERSARAEVEAKVTELEQDKKDTGKRINNMNAEIERNESTIKRLKQTRERLTEFTPRTEDIREECLALQYNAELHLNSLYKLFEEVNKEGPDAPEIRLQLEQIWIAANTAAARGLDVVTRILENSMFEDLPNRVLGQHILTPEEASRWLLEYPMIEARHQAEKLAREEKREQAKPKGRGRPKLSTKADE